MGRWAGRSSIWVDRKVMVHQPMAYISDAMVLLVFFLVSDYLYASCSMVAGGDANQPISGDVQVVQLVRIITLLPRHFCSTDPPLRDSFGHCIYFLPIFYLILIIVLIRFAICLCTSI